MKNYRVKVNCPGFGTDNKQTIDNDGYLRIGGLKVKPEWYPEIFEEIKEPLFVTEDGVPFFEMAGSVFEVYKTSEKIKDITLDWYSNNNPEDFISFDDYKYFSSKESAEKWIEENKPVFSRKQIKDAIFLVENPGVNCNFMLTHNFKKELGL